MCGRQVGRIRRGNYVFVTWKGDHPPRHVHVYRDGRLVLRWNLESDVAMTGTSSRRILKILAELRKEGWL